MTLLRVHRTYLTTLAWLRAHRFALLWVLAWVTVGALSGLAVGLVLEVLERS